MRKYLVAFSFAALALAGTELFATPSKVAPAAQAQQCIPANQMCTPGGTPCCNGGHCVPEGDPYCIVY